MISTRYQARCSLPRRRSTGSVPRLASLLLVGNSPLAFAKGRRSKRRRRPRATIVPYMIVIVPSFRVGLMTVCRPSRRADKPPEKSSDDDE